MWTMEVGVTRATVIRPGETVIPDAQTETGLINNYHSSLFSIGAGTGFLNSAVYIEPSGMLDFVYQLSNYTDPSSIIGGTFSNFMWLGVDVGYEPGTGYDITTGMAVDLPPTSADRSATGFGSLLSFNFLGDQALPTGETSDLLIVRTTAIGYFTYFGTVTDSEGNQADGVPFFGPIPVPEPSTGSLALLGGLGLIAVGRFRQPAQARMRGRRV